MNKNTIWIIAGVLAVLLICCVCTVAGYFIYTRSGLTAPVAATPFVFPTPNSTLTALYSIPTLSQSTATPQSIVPTFSGYPTATNTVTPWWYPSVTPTITVTPYWNRPSGSVNAAYLSTAPEMDGIWDEWHTAQFPINSVVYDYSDWSGNNDLLGSYRIGWDYTYLYLAVKVHDDKYVQVSTGESIYKGDSLEILLDTDLTGDISVQNLDWDDYQIGISPGKNEPGSNEEAYLWYPGDLAGERGSIKVGAFGGDGLYRIEVAIPWSVLRVSPYTGLEMGFAVSISDNDKSGAAEEQTMMSSSPYRILYDPTTWGTLILN
jgi:hypothetical protein